ncbi:hypothetical protein Tsubulata_008012 [Turnera subulata]|uniref:Uncharacterized protein n=1 Tax=Turnera subulata TaxID=218843 RepID=A0A9Q0FL64_9ROSI|nr:hypothetical protein Tsubulata_008012 [Turnera subulata]
MEMPRSSVLLLLLLALTPLLSQEPRTEAARTLSFLPQENFSKVFATLGVVCKCCDGTEGECTTTWTGSCHKPQCLPWRIG